MEKGLGCIASPFLFRACKEVIAMNFYKILYPTLFLLSTLSCNKSFYQKKDYNFEDAKSYLSYRPDFKPLTSAHRGGQYYDLKPENSIEAFEHSFRNGGKIIECDVQLSKDSMLFLIHDYSLDRTTNRKGEVREMYWKDIKGTALIDHKDQLTKSKIPSLKRALKWGKRKGILMLDVKRGVPYDLVINEVEKYKASNKVTIITYTLEGAKEVYKLDSDLLISVGIQNEEQLNDYLNAGIPPENLVAFTGLELQEESLYKLLHEKGILVILGTLRNLDKDCIENPELYKTYIEKGVNILATDYPIIAGKAIK